MVLSAHQPHYLPWLGYFDKISNSDIFVFLDNVQYKRREFQNRNKIRLRDGTIWLIVPVLSRENYYIKIKDVRIDNSIGWQGDHWKSILLNYKKTPDFTKYADFFESVYTKQKWDRLEDLNVAIIKYILEVLGIKRPIYFEKDLNIEKEKTERIIDICKVLGVDSYLSGMGGKNYLQEHRFKEEGIELQYQNYQHPRYRQYYPGFQSQLSIIDLLFNHGDKSFNILTGRAQ